MLRTLHITILLLALPVTAAAGPAQWQRGFLDLYYVPSAELDIEVPGFGRGSDDGDGYGLRGLAPFSERAAFSAEYQSNRYDDSGLDLDQLRLGIGLISRTGSGVFFEYIDMDFDNEPADGPGVHLRLASRSAETLSLFAQIGYLSLEDEQERLAGPEFSLGAAYAVDRRTSAFVDFRRTQLEGRQSRAELELTDLRFGIRLYF